MNPSHESVMRSTQLAGRVVRYHTWPMIRRPTVAEASARVATLYCELWGLPRAEVLYYCLHHDNGELYGGDIPFYAKRRVAGLSECSNEAEKAGLKELGVTLPELTPTEYKQFKIVDYLEMWETAVVEANMGNRYALIVLDNLKPAVYDLADKLGVSARIERWLLVNCPVEWQTWK